jgi:CelD/BcsL family acetyltransferase involved in cellulose biosynthesis
VFLPITKMSREDEHASARAQAFVAEAPAPLKVRRDDAARPQVRLIEDPRALAGLEDLWNALGSGLSSPMQHFSWTAAALETVCTADRLRFVLLRQGPSAALAPLVRSPGWLPVLRVIGVSRLGEPMDFLYSDEAALDALAVALCRAGDPLCLEHLLDDTRVLPALERAYAGRGWIRVDPMNACPVVPLHAGWQDPMSQFNAGRRSDFRRSQRHAEKHGRVGYEVLSPAPGEVDGLLDEAYAVETRSWKGHAGTDLLTDRPLGDFYRRVARSASERGDLRIGFMRIDGRAVAMQVMVEHARRLWLLKIGYDEGFARCSAGNLLMLEAIGHAAQRGLVACEFLGSAEAWTRVWTEQVRQQVKIRVYPYNLRGALYFTADATAFAAKRLRRFAERLLERLRRPPAPERAPH